MPTRLDVLMLLANRLSPITPHPSERPARK